MEVMVFNIKIVTEINVDVNVSMCIHTYLSWSGVLGTELRNTLQ